MSYSIVESVGRCSICLDPCNNGELVLEHDGWHAIHAVCLSSLIETGRRTCPECRINITSINGIPVSEAPAAAPPALDLLSLQAIAHLIEQDLAEFDSAEQAMIDALRYEAASASSEYQDSSSESRGDGTPEEDW